MPLDWTAIAVVCTAIGTFAAVGSYIESKKRGAEKIRQNEQNEAKRKIAVLFVDHAESWFEATSGAANDGQFLNQEQRYRQELLTHLSTFNIDRIGWITVASAGYTTATLRTFVQHWSTRNIPELTFNTRTERFRWMHWAGLAGGLVDHLASQGERKRARRVEVQSWIQRCRRAMTDDLIRDI